MQPAVTAENKTKVMEDGNTKKTDSFLFIFFSVFIVSFYLLTDLL